MRIDTARFTVERVVGSGAMGTVFRAIDRHTGAPVALKVLRGTGHAARFEREADVLARLRHPGIAHYVGHGTTDHGEPFLAMEWVEGRTLHAIMREPGLGLAEALRVAIGIADALGAAHAAGVVHRDVKPSNVMLEADRVDQVKLVDFGIARAPTADGTLTAPGKLVGTPSYMAPEQGLHARHVSPAADVFSLGCVLHECLTGSPPSAAAGAGVAQLRPELPSVVRELLDRLLAAAPAQRPADGAEARRELERVAREELPVLPPPRTLTPASFAASATIASFSRLHAPAGAPLSDAAARAVEVLGRYVPMPMAVLRSQCELHAKDPQQLTGADIVALSDALADAVARFTAPGRRAVVLAELRSLAVEGSARS